MVFPLPFFCSSDRRGLAWNFLWKKLRRWNSRPLYVNFIEMVSRWGTWWSPKNIAPIIAWFFLIPPEKYPLIRGMLKSQWSSPSTLFWKLSKLIWVAVRFVWLVLLIFLSVYCIWKTKTLQDTPVVPFLFFIHSRWSLMWSSITRGRALGVSATGIALRKWPWATGLWKWYRATSDM